MFNQNSADNNYFVESSTREIEQDALVRNEISDENESNRKDIDTPADEDAREDGFKMIEMQ
jgi:hypothetical protein